MGGVSTYSRRFLTTIQLVLFLAVEAGWLTAWSSGLSSWTGGDATEPILGAIPIGGLLIASTVGARVVTTRLSAARWAKTALALLGLVLALIIGAIVVATSSGWSDWSTTWHLVAQTNLGLRAGGAAGLTLIAWWRGIAAGRTRLWLEDVESAFRGAILALATLFLLDMIASPPTARGTNGVVGAAVVVLFAGLVGLPLARICDLSERPRHQDGPPLTVRGHWLAILLGTVGILLLVTSLLAQVLTFERIDALLQPLAGPAEAVFWALFYVIVVPLGFVVEILIYLFRLVIHPRSVSEPPQAPGLDWAQALRDQAKGGASPPVFLVLAAKWALVALLVAVILWLLARAIFRFSNWGNDDDVAESHDFVWSWSALGEGLRRLLKNLLGWRPPAIAALITARSTPASADVHLWGPRELYREFLRLGARYGHARSRAETPSEYERSLTAVSPFDTSADAVSNLTNVYEQARYAQKPPDEVMVAAARAALAQLEALDAVDSGKSGSDAPLTVRTAD